MLNLFKSKSVQINTNEIIREGWLSKESKFLKAWRELIDNKIDVGVY